MSYSRTSVEEIHTLQAKLEGLVKNSSNLSEEILKVSEEIDLMLLK